MRPPGPKWPDPLNDSTTPGRRDRDAGGTASLRQRLPLFVGGFLGPFGTIVLLPMYPELREEFNATNAEVNLAFSFYLIPFALVLIVSGTLGERWGRRRTIQITYVLFALASIAAAAAPNLPLLVAARALQGIANAFITPLLIAGLAELVPPERFGREVGIYSSFQALGGGLGPVVGGLAADTNWRLAFVGTAAVCVVLAFFPPSGEPRPSGELPSFRRLFERRLLVPGVAFFLLAAGPIGIGVVVAIGARDVFELSGTGAGAVLLFGTLSALVLGPFWGRVVDRLGTARSAVLSVAAVSCACLAMTLAQGAFSLGALWALAAGLSALTVVVFQALGADMLPENRGGGLSFLLAFRFLGHAIGPLVLVPLVDRSLDVALLLAAALGLLALGLVGLQLRTAPSTA